jgi:hypothetical protein
MKTMSPFLTVLFAAYFVSARASAEESESPLSELARGLQADSPDREWAKRYQDEFENTTIDELRRLINHENSSFALRAAWELQRRRVAEHGPSYERAGWMLGFMEARVGVRPLREVAFQILTKVGSAGGSDTFAPDATGERARAMLQDYEQDVPKWTRVTMDRLVLVPEGTTLEKEGDSILVGVNGATVAIPRKHFREFRLERPDGRVGLNDFIYECLQAVRHGERWLILLHNPVGRHRARLMCVDGEGEVLWTTRAWVNWVHHSMRKKAIIGGDNIIHDLVMAVANDRVVIFGCGRHIYIESFDIATGEVVCRFSSYDWRVRD